MQNLATFPFTYTVTATYTENPENTNARPDVQRDRFTVGLRDLTADDAKIRENVQAVYGIILAEIEAVTIDLNIY